MSETCILINGYFDPITNQNPITNELLREHNIGR